MTASTMKNLDELTDAELNEAFAVEVAKIWQVETPRDGGLRAYSVVQTGAWREIRKDAYAPEDLPDYSTDANAVLPWLEKCRYWKADQSSPDGVWVVVDAPNFAQEYADTFARAAVLALLRAARAR